jgi:3-methylfumaryl-CoA hydratase
MMTQFGIDIEHLRLWIGRTERADDRLSLEHVRTIAATFDHQRMPEETEALPPLWHWAFFRPAALARDIGLDGHPRRGGFLPPIPLPRRMWVGGEVNFSAPLPIGARLTRETTIVDVTAKHGRGGALVFLTLEHNIRSEGTLLIREMQNIVYREAAPVGALPERVVPQSAPREREAADWREALVPDPVLLFRYSALTFNAHRIHYDSIYARSEEGYPGLVVHGPLTATLLMDRLVNRHGPAVRRFAFRARQPLFCGEPMGLCGEARPNGEFDLWAETPSGELAMSAEASY